MEVHTETQDLIIMHLEAIAVCIPDMASIVTSKLLHLFCSFRASGFCPFTDAQGENQIGYKHFIKTCRYILKISNNSA